ncbi:glycosyltransferase [Candidatus Saccharibacteria bacterium]|nr:glycosyltransferase [Candidatus Saccharibacteria bacterium]
MSAKVSVVVAIYNVEKYLKRCLTSLANQSLEDIEIICVNDGSKDKSVDIVKDFAKKDKRFVLVDKENGGLSSARNAGLEKVRTKYVMFCDGDDFYSPTMCEEMVDAIERDQSDLCACMANIIYEAHEELKGSDDRYYTLKYVGKKYMHECAMLNTDVSAWDKIFRMDIINKYNIRFPDGLNNEDFYFFNAYACVSRTITFLYRRLYNYVRREGSIMSNNFKAEKCSMDHMLVAERLFDFYKERGFLQKHKNLFWRQWLDGYWFSLRSSHKKFHDDIKKVAVEFLNKNLSTNRPDNIRLQKGLDCVMGKRFAYRILRKARSVLGRVYSMMGFANKDYRSVTNMLRDLSLRNDVVLQKIEKFEGKK